MDAVCAHETVEWKGTDEPAGYHRARSIDERNATATAATLSAALMTVVLLQFFTGSLADRYGRRFVLGSAALAGGFTSLGCALAASWSQLLVMRILGGVADAVAMPALLGLTVETSHRRMILRPLLPESGCNAFPGQA